MATMLPGVRPEHLLRAGADRLDAAGDLVDRDHRGLVDDDAPPLGVHAGIGRPEIDGQVSGEKRQKRTKTHVVQNRAAPAYSAWAMRTPFLPESFTWYIAISAARTNSSAEAATSGSVATPTDAVSRSFKPFPAETDARQSLPNAVSDRRGTFGASVGQDDCKLVATEPGHHVGFTRAAANHARPPRRAPGSPPGARGCR